jgi:hypothetical protein
VANGYVTSICSKLSDPNSVFVQCNARLYYSNNGGISWNDVTPNVGYLTSIQGFTYRQSDNALYAHNGQSLGKSTDNGSSWTVEYYNWSFFISGLTAHPSANTLYGARMSINNPSIYNPAVSYNGGVNWITAYPNLNLTSNSKLCVDLSDPAYAYYATQNGILRLYMSGFSEISEHEQLTPNDFDISTYPNPFNSSVNFRYMTNEASVIKIKIFNLEGQLISELNCNDQGQGFHTIKWDTRGQPSGIYFYEFQGNKSLKKGKLTLLK